MLDINNSWCTTRHLITLLETFLTIFFFNIRIKTTQYFLKATQTINMKMNIQLLDVVWQITLFFSFRNLCLETVNRFIDYEWKCDFGLDTEKNILQNGRFFKIIFIILSQFIFLICRNWVSNLFTFVKDVLSINSNRITFEIVPIYFLKSNFMTKWFHTPACIENLNQQRRFASP